MQFPVPQFTDVEDKIIGNLTIKQFGIVFGAGILVFLGYSATKSLFIVIFLAIIIGLPAVAVAFGRINGRPLYQTFPVLVNFIFGAKVFVFKKEASEHKTAKVVKSLVSAEAIKPEASSETKRGRLHELQLQLEQSVSDKEKLLNKDKQ